MRSGPLHPWSRKCVQREKARRACLTFRVVKCIAHLSDRLVVHTTRNTLAPLHSGRQRGGGVRATGARTPLRLTLEISSANLYRNLTDKNLNDEHGGPATGGPGGAGVQLQRRRAHRPPHVRGGARRAGGAAAGGAPHGRGPPQGKALASSFSFLLLVSLLLLLLLLVSLLLLLSLLPLLLPSLLLLVLPSPPSQRQSSSCWLVPEIFVGDLARWNSVSVKSTVLEHYASPSKSSELISSTSTWYRYRAGIPRVVQSVGGHHSLTAVLVQVELKRGAVQGPALWRVRTPRCTRTSSRRSVVGPDAATPHCLLIAHTYTTAAAAAAAVAVLRFAAGDGLSRRHLLTALPAVTAVEQRVCPGTHSHSPHSHSRHPTSPHLEGAGS